MHGKPLYNYGMFSDHLFQLFMLEYLGWSYIYRGVKLQVHGKAAAFEEECI